MRKTKSLLSLLLAVAMACTLVIPAAAVDTGQTDTTDKAVLSVAETSDGTFTVSLDPKGTEIACVQFTVNDTGLTVADAQPETDADFAYHGYGSNTYAAAGRDKALTETTALLTITAADKTAEQVTAAITPVAAYEVNGTDTVDVAVQAAPVSTGHTVSGTVTSYITNEEALTVTLYDAAGTTKVKDADTIGSYEAVSGATGKYTATYSFAGVADGTYTLKVKKRGHAPWTETVEVASTDVTGKDVAIYQYGDVSRNGIVNSTDALQAAQYVAKMKKRTFDDYQKSLADVNSNGLINSSDVLWIKQCAANIRNDYYAKKS